MEKKAFRQQQLARLQQMTPASRQVQTANLLAQLTQPSAWQQAQTIAVTISSPIEVNTQPIMAAAWAAGKNVVIPQTLPHRQMAFLPHTATSPLARTKFGILEPTTGTPVDKSKIDLILVPGLGYSLDRHARIGFGGGYYDRYLADFTGTKLTLAYREMAFKTAQWPVDDYDILLDTLLVAEDGVDDKD